MNPLNSDNQATPNAAGATNEYYESPATLMDKDGQLLASVTVKILPKQNCGDFRLLSSADVHQILTKATSLQTSDGKRFQLIDLRRCIGFHLMNPDHPHLEFDYKPMER